MTMPVQRQPRAVTESELQDIAPLRSQCYAHPDLTGALRNRIVSNREDPYAGEHQRDQGKQTQQPSPVSPEGRSTDTYDGGRVSVFALRV
jgi:hypothetical protein